MTTIVTRAGKGAPLTNTEMDTNLTNLNTDKVEGAASSVDNELMLFSGTGGKTAKRASATGILTATSGVLGTAVSGTDLKTVGGVSIIGSGDISVGTGDVTGQVSSVDNEIALFSGTGGKTIKRATTSGVLKGTSGVISAASAGTDYVAPGALTGSGLTVATSDRILGRDTAGSGAVEELTLSAVLDFIGSAAQGDILYRGASSWSRLGAGTNGHFLKTQGAGANPTWAAATSAGSYTVQTFSANGTWNKPANCQAVLFLAWGGGGGGAGVGGGGLGYSMGGFGGAFNAVLQTSPASSYAITIGAGGSGGVSGSSGNTGSSTTVGAILTAAGGALGRVMVNSTDGGWATGGSSRGQGGTTSAASASANTGGGGAGSASGSGGNGGSGYVIAVEFY